MVLKLPAMIDRNLTFFVISSGPVSGENLSGFVSSSLERFVEKPTWASMTDWSGWAARVFRSKPVASGAFFPVVRSCG